MDGSSMVRDVCLVLIAVCSLIGLRDSNRTKVRLKVMDDDSKKREQAREDRAERRNQVIAREVEKVAKEAATVKADLIAKGDETSRETAERFDRQEEWAREHDRLIRLALATIDGPLREEMAINASLLRRIAESPGATPDDLAAADAAATKLAKHDEESERIRSMSSDSLERFVDDSKFELEK